MNVSESLFSWLLVAGVSGKARPTPPVAASKPRGPKTHWRMFYLNLMKWFTNICCEIQEVISLKSVFIRIFFTFSWIIIGNISWPCGTHWLSCTIESYGHLVCYLGEQHARHCRINIPRPCACNDHQHLQQRSYSQVFHHALRQTCVTLYCLCVCFLLH